MYGKVILKRSIWINIIYLFLISYAVGDCYWQDVYNSHFYADQQFLNEWCPDGYAITALDYDAFDDDAASPEIRGARCCKIRYADQASRWSHSWQLIGLTRSHRAQEFDPMCPEGSYMTAIDLDAEGDGLDSPVIGRVRCNFPVGGYPTWSQFYWKPVGYDKTHQEGAYSTYDESWCNDGEFIVSLDLDAVDRGGDGLSPMVGSCGCSES